jgi:hypothetical protein
MAFHRDCRGADFVRYGEECVAIARVARTKSQRIMLLYIRRSFVWPRVKMKINRR